MYLTILGDDITKKKIRIRESFLGRENDRSENMGERKAQLFLTK